MFCGDSIATSTPSYIQKIPLAAPRAPGRIVDYKYAVSECSYHGSSHLAMSLYVQGLPTEHCMCWYFAALDVKISIHVDFAPPRKQRKSIQPHDLQHFGYQSSSSMRIRPGSPVAAATEHCSAECSQSVDRAPGQAIWAAGLWSGRGHR